MKRSLLVCVLVAATMATLATPARAVAPRRWVLGYYVGYQRGLMPASQIEWSTMTHLVVGIVYPRGDGTLDTRFDIGARGGPAMAVDLAGRARAHHVVPLLMIGGAGTHAAFAAAARTHFAALVRRLITVLRRYGFAGLDLDWEPVTTADEPYLLRLATVLRARVPSAVLTVPVGWMLRAGRVPRFYGALAARVDRLNVMTYGMAGAWGGWRTWYSSALTGSGPATPTAVDANVHAYLAAGVPRAKLGVGIGFYGTCWTGGVTGPRQVIGRARVVADDNVMSWAHIRARYVTTSAYRYDTIAQAPYLSYRAPHGPQRCTFVSYENARSIAAKARWAKAHGLGALIVWTVNQGHLPNAAAGHRDPLLATARRAFGA
jgi:chitinase